MAKSVQFSQTSILVSYAVSTHWIGIGSQASAMLPVWKSSEALSFSSQITLLILFLCALRGKSPHSSVPVKSDITVSLLQASHTFCCSVFFWSPDFLLNCSSTHLFSVYIPLCSILVLLFSLSNNLMTLSAAQESAHWHMRMWHWSRPLKSCTTTSACTNISIWRNSSVCSYWSCVLAVLFVDLWNISNKCPLIFSILITYLLDWCDG